jgi:hypothetical protein
MQKSSIFVDRCARIAKYAAAGTVLASSEYVKACGNHGRWQRLGTRDMRGVGSVEVFQLDRKTVDIRSLPAATGAVFWTGAFFMAAVVKLQQLELLLKLPEKDRPYLPETLLREVGEYLCRGIYEVEAVSLGSHQTVLDLQSIRKEIAARDVKSWNASECRDWASRIHNVLGKIHELPDISGT